MSYTDIGYDSNLVAKDLYSQNDSQQLDPQAFENFTDVISATKVQGGVLASPDGKTKFDLENNNFKVNDGTQDLISLGVLPDGSVGLLIKDNQGNTIMQVSASNFFFQSKSLKLDFIGDQLTVIDEQGIPVVLLGKLSS